MIGLLILTDWKKESYDSILVIINSLIKMVYYKLVRVTINTLRLAMVFFNVVVYYYGFSDFIIINRGSLFIS